MSAERTPPRWERLLEQADAIIRQLDELQGDVDLEDGWDQEGIDEREPEDYAG